MEVARGEEGSGEGMEVVGKEVGGWVAVREVGVMAAGDWEEGMAVVGWERAATVVVVTEEEDKGEVRVGEGMAAVGKVVGWEEGGLEVEDTVVGADLGKEGRGSGEAVEMGWEVGGWVEGRGEGVKAGKGWAAVVRVVVGLGEGREVAGRAGVGTAEGWVAEGLVEEGLVAGMAEWDGVGMDLRVHVPQVN